MGGSTAMLDRAQGSDLGFDVEAIRADFPILGEEVYGKPLVFLDNGASAQKPRQVMDRMNEVMEAGYANVHRGLHFMSNKATQAYEDSRETARRFLNAESTDQIVFTSGGTAAMNLVAYGYLASRIQPGDEIVLSIMEHHSNIVPWHFLRERHGAVLKWVDVSEEGVLDLDALADAITDRTKMVAVTHMSNVLGTINPVREISDLAHAKGVPVMVDGCQGAVHTKVDVQALGCDFYVVTGHKLYGPTGIGILYGTKDILAETQPFLGGGEMIREVTTEGVVYNDPPHRFEAGTPPIIEAIGLGAAMDYVDSIGREAIEAHEADLADYASEQLGQINSLRVFGEAPGKGAIFSFELEGIHAHDVSMVIDREGVAVRAGTHCCQPLMARYGVTSTCRASFGMYNTRAEVDKLVAALRKAQEFFG
ncbi:MAG: cysteine desulfurase [Pseudomonadota bacterium]